MSSQRRNCASIAKSDSNTVPEQALVAENLTWCLGNCMAVNAVRFIVRLR